MLTIQNLSVIRWFCSGSKLLRKLQSAWTGEPRDKSEFLNPNAYDLIISKHAELSNIITKCAADNRAPSSEESARLTVLKSEIDAIKSEWESTGRNAFLASLSTEVKKSQNGQIVLKSADSFAKHVEGTYPQEFKSLSIGKILRGYINGNWDDAELEMKAMGSTPLSSGGALIPTPLAAEVIDLARNKTRVLQAGAITVPMSTATLRYARLDSDVSANWTLEASNIATSAATFDSVTFTAHKLAALVAIDNELLEDAANTDAEIMLSISKALAIALDLAALYGSGTAPVPLGLHGNVPAYPVGGSAMTNFDPMLRAIALVREANFEPNAAIYAPRTADSLGRLKTGLAGDQRFLPPPTDWANLAKYVSQSGSNESWFRHRRVSGVRRTVGPACARPAIWFAGGSFQRGQLLRWNSTTIRFQSGPDSHSRNSTR